MTREGTYTLAIAGTDLVAQVVRKPIRNLNLHVRNDGSVWASVPLRTTRGEAQAFLDAHGLWVERRVERRSKMERGFASALLDGGTTTIWGEELRVTWVEVERGRASASLVDGQVVLALPPDARGGDEASAARRETALYELLRRELERELPQVARECEAVVGQHALEWRTRRMRTRWGSCSIARRRIWLNVALATKPRACLAYVVTHELCHLIDPHHDARFHALMDGFCPDGERLRRLLNS